MATAQRESRDRPQPKGAASAPRKRRTGRWLVLLALLAATLWFLPLILCKTPLLNWAIRWGAKDLNGTVTVRSASVGWLSPLQLEDVEVKDNEGKPVLSIAALRGNRTLVSLVRDYTDLGSYEIQKPKLAILLRDTGSNLEDLLANYLAPKPKTEESTSSSSKFAFAIRIIDGAVSITDQVTGRGWQAEKLNVGFDMSQGPDGPATGELLTELPDPRRPGKIAGQLKMAGSAGEASLSVTELPLAISRALAARFSPGTSFEGRLSSEVRASWGGANGGNFVQAALVADTFSLANAWLQNDVVQTDQVRAACEVAWQADRINIQKATIDCDLANLSAIGTIPLKQQEGVTLAALLQQRQRISGRLDLARLARLLPNTLRLRRNMQINSGAMQLALSSEPQPKGTIWRGQLQSSNLAGVANGRQIAWQQPILAVIEAHDTANGPVVDSLRCESDFLKLQGQGTLDNLTASATFNLQQLADRLGQFADLRELKFAGEGNGRLNWQRTSQGQFDGGVEMQLTGFQWAMAGREPWREESLLAFVSAKGQTDFTTETRIDSATLNVKAGSDKIEAQLTQPVANLRGGGIWPLYLKMEGQLQNWPARLAFLLPTNQCRLAGAYAFDADVMASKVTGNLKRVRFAAAPLTVASPWLTLNEPRIDLEAGGSWDWRARKLQIEPAKLNCPSLALQANNILVALPEAGPMELAGNVKYQGEIGRLRQWFLGAAPPAWQMAGQLTGEAQLQQTGNTIRGTTVADIANLAMSNASGSQFQEPRVRLMAAGNYDTKSSVLQLQKCELTSSVIAASAGGRMMPVNGRNEAQFDARYVCSMERLSSLLRPYLGPSIQLIGRNESSAWFRGPLSLAEGTGKAGLKWDGLNVYGFRAGPGELQGSMAKGIVNVQPLDLNVSQGRVHLAPQVRVSPEMEFLLPAGPLVQKVQIDPAMCGSALQYIAPVLAGVTSAQGAFSIDLDRCRIPLGDPSQGDLAGRFTFHSVSIGPGPLIRELAVFMKRETPAQLRRESVVPFYMTKGRVYHDNLELLFPDVTVRSRGSVGLDQSLDVLLQMPVPPKWMDQNPTIAQALRNQTITVPLRGTLVKPQLDQRVMQDLTRQFLQKAAGNLIEGELNRLFGPAK